MIIRGDCCVGGAIVTIGADDNDDRTVDNMCFLGVVGGDDATVGVLVVIMLGDESSATMGSSSWTNTPVRFVHNGQNTSTSCDMCLNLGNDTGIDVDEVNENGNNSLATAVVKMSFAPPLSVPSCVLTSSILLLLIADCCCTCFSDRVLHKLFRNVFMHALCTL